MYILIHVNYTLFLSDFSENLMFSKCHVNPTYKNSCSPILVVFITEENKSVYIIIIIIIITVIVFSFGGSSPYTSTNKTNKNKYT